MGEPFFVWSLDVKPTGDTLIRACCEECGDVRVLPRQAYRDLCQACVKRTESFRRAKSEWALKRFENQAERQHLSEIRKAWWRSPRRYLMCGENNHQWNPHKTRDERYKRRAFPEYRAWRTSIFEKFDYTCVVCGKRGGKLAAHHLESFASNPDLRIDPDNGVCICADTCHKEFHRIYGVKNNTKEQFERFLIMKWKEVNDDESHSTLASVV